MAFQHIQSKGYSNDNATTQMQLAFDTNVTAGSLIVLCLQCGDNPSISDTRGNSYQLAVEETSTKIYYCVNVGSGANTVTVDFDSADYNRMSIHEFSGNASSGVLDVAAHVLTNPGSSATDGDTTGAATVTVDGALIVGCIMDIPSSWAIAAGTNFNEAYDNSVDFQSEYRILIREGSYAATWTASNTDGYRAVMAVFKPVADTYPYVVGSNTRGGTSLSGGVALNMPPNILAGDLLLAFCCNDNPGTTNMGISGWTQVFQSAYTGNVIKHAVFAKIAAGGDTATLTGALQDYATVVVCIANHGVSNIANDIKVGTAATGSTWQPNPPSLNAGSSKKWLWFASHGADDDDGGNATPYPANFTGVAENESAQSTSSCMVAAAWRKYEAQTLDSGMFNLTSSSTPEEWVANTIAIPPYGINQTIAAGLLSGTCTINSVSRQLGITNAAGLLQGSGQIQVASLSRGSSFGVGILAGAGAIQAVAAKLGYSQVVGLLDASGSIQSVSTKRGFGAVLNILQAASSIGSVALSRGSTMQVNVLNGAGEIHDVLVVRDILASLGILQGNVSINQAAFGIGASAQLNALSASAGISPAVLSLGITQAISVLQGAAEIEGPSLSLGMTIPVGGLQAAVIIASPSLSISVTRALQVLEASGAILAATVQVGGGITVVVGLLPAAGTINSASLSIGVTKGLQVLDGGATISPVDLSIGITSVLGALAGQSTLEAAEVSLGVDILLGILDDLGEIKPVTVVLPPGDVTVTVGFLSGSSTLGPVGISIGVDALLGLLSADASVLGVGLRIDWSTVLNLLTADGTLNPATVQVIIFPSPEVYKAIARERRIYEGPDEKRIYQALRERRIYKAPE